MKSLLIAIVTAFTVISVSAESKAPTPPKTKKVCKADKNGKEVCKTIKVRKKLEGKPVPK